MPTERLEVIGARTSELVELRRLGAGIVVTEAGVASRMPPTVWQVHFLDVRASRVVTFRAPQQVDVPSADPRGSPLQYRIGNARDRFALLAFIANTFAAKGELRTANDAIGKLFAFHAALSPALTEGELCARLDVDVSTFRRWFDSACAKPGTVLRLGRVARLAEELRRGTSLDSAALAVGYSTASNARRAMRFAVSVLPKQVKGRRVRPHT